MKIVLTCGHPTSGYEMIHRVLLNSGLHEAVSCRHEQFSPADFQRKLCIAHEVPAVGAGEVMQVDPGKVWQNLAVDLFIANMENENWGWADVNTVHLLAFWHDFDPQIRFVLTYSSPATALARLENVADKQVKEVIEDALQSWLFFNDQLLLFYARHQDRCLLINADAVARVEGQEKLLPLLREQRGLSLGTQVVKATALEHRESPIFGLIASQMLEEMPEVRALYDELEGSADLFSGESNPRSVLAEMAMAEYQRLANSLKAGQIALRELASKKHEAQRLSLEKLSALEQALAVREREAERHKNDAKQAKENQEELKEKQEEKELLLRQLHQVQEELQVYFLKAKELTSERDEARRLSADKLSALERKLATREREAERLTATAAERATKNEELIRQGEHEAKQLRLQLQQAQEALERDLRKAKELAIERDRARQLSVEKLAALEKIVSVREAEAERHKKDATQAKRRADDLEREVAEGKRQATKLRELEQENELLLLQLHQVQEELENYFLKYQEVNANKQAASAQANSAPSLPITIDLTSDVQGDNWYEAEPDGRWAGPERSSTISVPLLQPGEYRMELDILDAMSPSILQNMAISFNDRTLFFTGDDRQPVSAAVFDGRSAKQVDYPVTWQTVFRVLVADAEQPGKLRFDFSRLLPPRAGGARKHAIFLKTVRIVPILDREIHGVDLRNRIVGRNWYEPEIDGRWAGPGPVSMLVLPAVKPGRYQIGLEIVDAIAPEVLKGVQYKLAGKPVYFADAYPQGWLTQALGKRRHYPIKLVAEVQLLPEQCASDLELEFSFVKLISPASRGSADQRMLAIRLKNVTLKPLSSS